LGGQSINWEQREAFHRSVLDFAESISRQRLATIVPLREEFVAMEQDISRALFEVCASV
jgi:hypothetical protein